MYFKLRKIIVIFYYQLRYLLTYLLTHSLNPHSTVLLQKLTGLQLKKFPTFRGTRMFNIKLTSARHLILS
jgi:hypothetical protein